MIKIFLLTIFLLIGKGYSAPFYDDFRDNFLKDYLEPFVKDFGGVLGANDFNTARNLGFPGFDVGFDFAIQKEPSSDNRILKKSDVKSFGMPLVHASVGVPLTGMDATLRGFSYSGLNIIGGGLRYKIFKSGMFTKFMPDLSVMAFYDNITFDYFEGSHISFDLVGSWDLPIVKPFVGAGLDRTKLEVKDIDNFDGESETVSKTRYTFGVKFCPIPLIYLYGAYSRLHGESGYNFGLGVRF
ncbi:MAG: hypothetical protein K6357_02140 [Elusimicrobiota bacterium]